MQMNYALATENSKLRAFTELIQVYFEGCLEKGKDSYQVISLIEEIWGDRIKEWGWDLTDFLTIMLEFYEGLQENRI